MLAIHAKITGKDSPKSRSDLYRHSSLVSRDILRVDDSITTGVNNDTAMASGEGVVDGTPLKGPVFEVIDLTSDNSSVDGPLNNLLQSCIASAKRDSAQENESGEESGEEQWESESFYEDFVEGLGDEDTVSGGRTVVFM